MPLALILAAALVEFVGAHLALVAGLSMRREWWRAAVALVVLPLAPWWGWQRGMRLRVFVWIGGLAVYAAGVLVA